MQLNKNIVLVGMMGSGKSTIGYLVSKKLALKFRDADKEIEKENREKIVDIFSSKVKSILERLRKITLKFIKSENSVIALGGVHF